MDNDGATSKKLSKQKLTRPNGSGGSLFEASNPSKPSE